MPRDFKNLFASLDIKNVHLRNRICMPPVVMFGLSDESAFANNRHVEHYRRIAQGGVGLIIQEASCVAADGKLSKNQLGIWDDKFIDPLRDIVDAVHAEGVPIFIQLHYAGLLGIQDINLSPSDFSASYRNRQVTGKEMSHSDMQRIDQAFVKSALRAKKIGYDGIEIHAAHGYLFSQFLNTRLNTRTDAYGLDPSLYLREVFSHVKEAVGDTMVVGARFGCFEPRIQDGIKHAHELVKLGADFLDVSRGCLDLVDNPTPQDWPYSPLVYGAKLIKENLEAHNITTPVFTVDRITNPDMAERIRKETHIDVIDIARGTLVNPCWANDAFAQHEVGACLDCHECCFRHDDPEHCPGRLRLSKLRAQA